MSQTVPAAKYTGVGVAGRTGAEIFGGSDDHSTVQRWHLCRVGRAGVGGRLGRWAALVGALALLALPASAAAVRVEPFSVTTPDGTVLRGHVHLPDGDGPFATVLDFSPYWNGPAYGPSDAADALDSPGLQYLLDAGYAVAGVNMRGTGLSSGCTTFGGSVEWPDTRVVIEELARKPWSTGNIGMAGISFDGWSQFMAMAADPPSALKAVVPMSGVIDLWSLLTRRGAAIHEGPGVPMAWWALTSGSSIPPSPDHANCNAEHEENVEAGRELISTGDRSAYFEARDMRPHIQGSAIPALVSNGMTYIDEGHTLQYEGLWDLLRPNRTHLVLGQWGHGGQDSKPDWQQQVLGWFGHYLRGEPHTVPTGVVEYQDTSGDWHQADRWPPPSTGATVYLSGDGALSTDPPAETAPQTFPAVDGLDAAWWCGPQQALYASPPLAEDVLVAGNAQWELDVTSTEPGGNLVGVLMHNPDGSCGGRTNDLADVSRAMLDLRHWTTLGHGQDFPVGEPTRVSVPAMPAAARIAKGERLVLGVSGGAVELEPDPHHPTLTVTGGSVRLPVVEGELRFDQPAGQSR
jgi:predicted acyl esterase